MSKLEQTEVTWREDCRVREERCDYRTTVQGMDILVQEFFGLWKAAVFARLGKSQIMMTREGSRSADDAKAAGLEMVQDLIAAGGRGR